jgi:WD40 repeat protein
MLIGTVPRALCFVPGGGLIFVLLVALPAISQQTVSDWYVIGGHPNVVQVINGTDDEFAYQIPLRGRSPKELVPTPDGKRLYVSTQGRRQIKVVNMASRKVEDVIDLAPPGHTITIYGMAFSRDGRELFVHIRPVREMSDQYKVEPCEIVAFDVNTKKTVKIAEVPQGVSALVALKDGKRLVAWGRDLFYIDLASGRILSTYPLESNFAPGRERYNTLPLWVQYEQSGVLSVPYYTQDPNTHEDLFGYVNLDVDTGEVDIAELGPAVSMFSLVISPDRKRAYGVMNQLVTVDLTTKKIVDIRDTERTKYAANISHDGRKLYLGGAGPFIHVYDTGTLKLIKTVQLPGDASVTQFRAVHP